MSEILTPQESVRLCELERVIQKGKDTFVEVGNALAEIRDSRIYRATFKTFEDYCQERWQFRRDYVNKLIAASSVVSNLDTMVSKPDNERQARPLAKLPAEQQPAAWAASRVSVHRGGQTPAPEIHLDGPARPVAECFRRCLRVGPHSQYPRPSTSGRNTKRDLKPVLDTWRK